MRALLREEGTPVSPDAGRWHMMLVERLAEPAAAALDKAGDLPLGAKAVLAEHIADVIVAQGVGALSHRVVAQASGMAASSIAHHYASHRDILFAGVEAIYRRMRRDLRTSNAPAPGNADVLRLTHESALTALNNPAFVPFAIDMRRRRAENVHVQIADLLQMEDVYRLEKRGALTDPADKAARAMIYERTAAGAAMLRDLIDRAWRESVTTPKVVANPLDPANPDYDPETGSAPPTVR